MLNSFSTELITEIKHSDSNNNNRPIGNSMKNSLHSFERVGYIIHMRRGDTNEDAHYLKSLNAPLLYFNNKMFFYKKKVVEQCFGENEST